MPTCRYGSPKSAAPLRGNASSMLKVVLRPVRWSHGLSTQSTFVDELSTLISSVLATRQMMKHGSLQVRLAEGWGLPGAGSGAYKISVTLNCQIDEVDTAKTATVARAL